MKTEIRHENGYYSLYVNGVRLLDRESLVLAQAVELALLKPQTAKPSESQEVADAIRRSLDE